VVFKETTFLVPKILAPELWALAIVLAGVYPLNGALVPRTKPDKVFVPELYAVY